MAYIGFFLIMAGLAVAGGALDKGVSLATAVAMTAVGAALMWLFREDGDGGDGKEDGSPSCGGSFVDRPAGGDGEGTGVADAERRE